MSSAYPSLPSTSHCPKPVLHAKATTANAQHNWVALGASAAASAVLFVGVGLAAASTPSLPISSPSSLSLPPLTLSQASDDAHAVDFLPSNLKDEDEEFEKWKSKTFALSVPLAVLALRSSIPPSWVKDFIQSQGKRVRFRVKYLPTLDNIFSQLSTYAPSSDIVTIGDSSLASAIQNAIIEPIPGVEGQHWFQALTHKWKVYLRRNSKGEIDPHGQVWAAPYRWGTIVIAYKKSKFHKHKLSPIEVLSSLSSLLKK